MMISKRVSGLVVVAAALTTGNTASGQSFSDDFNSGPSALWGNESGSWTAPSGVYDSTFPNTSPNTHSSLPYGYADLILDVDVNDVHDGGIWLHSSPAGDSIGRAGVLLVTGAGPTGYTGLYWHVVTGGSYGSVLAPVAGLFSENADIHLTVTVVGNVYSAYVNGSPTPSAVLVDSTYATGQVALYDFSDQSFDNFSIVPEPGSIGLLAAGMGMMLRRRK